LLLLLTKTEENEWWSHWRIFFSTISQQQSRDLLVRLFASFFQEGIAKFSVSLSLCGCSQLWI
jgi:hypothetical protein